MSEATEFRFLADKVAREKPSEAWVSGLLTLALIVYAMYAVSKTIELPQNSVEPCSSSEAARHHKLLPRRNRPASPGDFYRASVKRRRDL